MTMPNMPEELQEEMRAMSAPKIEVVTRKGSPTSIDDYDSFMQFLMTAAMTSNLIKIRRLLEDDKSDQTIGYQVVITDQEMDLTLPRVCVSVSILNTSPNNVLCWFNSTENSPHRLRQNVPYQVDFKGHKLESIILRTQQAGVTAQVEIAVKY